MKYLRKFATQSDYDAYVESGEMETPNVSLVAETYTTFFTKKVVEEPEVLTYTFDCRDVPWKTNRDWLCLSKKLEGDFSELYDKIIDYLKAYGNKITDTYYALGEYGSETPLENIKISALVDDYKTGEEKVCHLCWIETSIDLGSINWGFNNVIRGGNNSGGECELTREYFMLASDENNPF